MKNYFFLAALLPVLALTTASNMSCASEEKKPDAAIAVAAASYAPEAPAPEAPKVEEAPKVDAAK